jgi:hypothetical protein
MFYRGSKKVRIVFSGVLAEWQAGLCGWLARVANSPVGYVTAITIKVANSVSAIEEIYASGAPSK